MKLKFSLILPSLALALSVGAGISFSKNNKVQSADAIGNYSTSASTYYNDITATSGTQLAAQLHDLITSTHRYYTSYDDNGSNGYQKHTDQYYQNGSKVSGYIYEFYSGAKWPNAWAASSGNTSGGYNREHCWCQSLSGGLWGTTGGGADMHHLRPVEVRLNSTRGNNLYGTVTNRDSNKKYAQLGSQSTYALGGYCANSTFEPLDSKKGDVARIILYTYLHYNSYSVTSLFGSYGTTNGNGQSSYFKTSLLPLTNVVKASSEANAIKLMLDWNASDPVDEIEQRRNEQVAVYQGNRNPFIDNSSYADAIWGTTGITSISKTSATIVTGNTTTISAISSNSGTISWSTSNSSVCSISSNSSSSGSTITLTAGNTGSATITASITISGQTYTKTCAVTVTAAKTLSSISVEDQQTAFTVGDSFSFGGTVTATYTDSTTANVSGSATFSGYNMLTAGNYTVTVSYTEGGTTKSTTYSITVNEAGSTSSSTIVMSEQGYTNQQVISSISGSGFDISLSKGTNSNTPKYFTTGSAIRLYGGNTLTISSSSTIVGVAFTFASGENSNDITSDVGTYSSGSWSGSTNSVIFTIGGTTGHRRIASITVTLEASSSSGVTLESISLDTTSVQTEFAVNDEFNYDGLIVTAHYSDESTEDLDSFDVSTPDMSTTGNKTVTVTYGEESETYTITVSSTILSSITIKTPPTKVSYDEGEYFDPTGLVLTKNYSNGTTEDYTYANHTSEFTFLPSTSTALTADDESVMITYGGKSVSQEITVTAPVMSDFEKITTESGLVAGKKYVIGNASGTVFMSTTQNTNNRGQTSGTVSNNVVTETSTMEVVELGGSTGAWTLHATKTEGYLSSNSNSNNNLRTESTANADKNKWTITFSNSTPSVQANAYDRKDLRYNSSSSIFSCYASGGQAAISLWKEVTTKTLSSITLDTTNVQTQFTVGSTFNYTGLVVTANYSDSSSSTVTPTSVSSPDMSSTGSKTVTVTYTEDGVSKTATYTITVSSNPSISWTAPVIIAYTGSTLTGNDVNGWAVTYNDGAGHTSTITYNDLTINLGGTTISIPHTWVAADDGKTLTVTYDSLTTTQSNAVEIVQSVNHIYADVTTSSTKTWTATAASNFGQTISPVGTTAGGQLTFDDTSTMTYLRTLEFVAENKADYLAFSDNYIQFGSSNALEKLDLVASTTGTVKSIVVDCWSKNGASTISATVGGNAFGSSQSTPSAKNSTPITFSGSATGNVVITMEKSTKTSGLAQYIKSVSITTETKSGTTQIANSASHKQAQKVAVKFAKAFNNAMSETSYCTINLSSAWSTCTSAYNTFLSEAAALGSTEETYAKNLIKYATRQYSDNSGEACIERMMKTYEVCVQKHGQTAFMSDLVTLGSAHVSPLIKLSGESTHTIAIIVIISMVSVTAIGGYFFLKKRKEHE